MYHKENKVLIHFLIFKTILEIFQIMNLNYRTLNPKQHKLLLIDYMYKLLQWLKTLFSLGYIFIHPLYDL